MFPVRSETSTINYDQIALNGNHCRKFLAA
jgi:hypothetical protein